MGFTYFWPCHLEKTNLYIEREINCTSNSLSEKHLLVFFLSSALQHSHYYAITKLKTIFKTVQNVFKEKEKE